MKKKIYSQKTYRSKHLILRPLRLADYQAWNQAHESSGKVDRWNTPGLPKSRRTLPKFKALLRRYKNWREKDEVYVWNIFLKNGEMIGWIDISTVEREVRQEANFGYRILGPFQRRGYAFEAARLIIPRVFKDLRFHRLEAAIDLDNRPSISFARSIGMHREGIKKFYWFQNGRWDDQVVFIATPELFRRYAVRKD